MARGEVALRCPTRPRIKVIGVGGAGSNAVDRMIQAGLGGVEFIAANTDAQALAQSEAPHRVQLGPRAARGLGVGGDPEWGARTAEESKEAIWEALRGAQVVFIAAGMGGGTGTGAAPVVARIAREQDALTIAAVTRPFSFEGGRRRDLAERGIMVLSRYVHSLIVVSNDRLLPLVGRDMTFDVALRVVDDVLRQGIQGISELITRPGLVNLDFASIRTALAGTGAALMAIGRGRGEDKAVQAAQSALSSPLLDYRLISSAETILVNITGGSDLTLHEVSAAAQLILEASHPGADILFGTVIDSQMEGEARVILVAGGIEAWGQKVQAPHVRSSASAFAPPVGVEAYPLDRQSNSSASTLQVEPDRMPGTHLPEPVPRVAYWPVSVPSQSRTGKDPGAPLGVAAAEEEQTRPSPVPSPSPPSRPALSSSALSPSASSTSPDRRVAQDPVPSGSQDSDGQEFEAEPDAGNQREKSVLRFLPNLDLPAFLRR